MVLSTHVLDISLGEAAAGLEVELFSINGEKREQIVSTATSEDGRAAFGAELSAGLYELVFHVGDYFTQHGIASLYTEVPVRFRVSDAKTRYHLPLLLSPWGYSTYRGS